MAGKSGWEPAETAKYVAAVPAIRIKHSAMLLSVSSPIAVDIIGAGFGFYTP
jgi:hypothetical protein